ncbi:transcriptional regulator [Spirochaetia bacterium]|nr:transcriptional regulator [Spirochaetia bacterium]
MKLSIPYHNRSFAVEFPDEYLLAVAEPNEYTADGSTETIFFNALSSPFGADGKTGISLNEFLQGGRRILIIINDATRPTPTEKILLSLLPVLDDAHISIHKITLLVATGGHRAPTETEYKQILGGLYDILRERCIAHNARKDDAMADIGTTRNGTPMLLNKLLFEADRIIATGSVEPHYFAGWTGGRKAFLPGIAAYKTIEANHKQALSPAAHSLALDGNPVHEDMMDALPLIKTPVFSFMTVLDKEQGVAAATTGDLNSSFYAAVDIAKKIFCVPVKSKADIVISVAKFPMDIDLYQSQKAIDNGSNVLKDGGTLILVSSCRDGIGDEAYANLLAAASTPQDAIEKIRSGYKLGYHKAAKMAAVSARASIKAVTELPEARLKSMFIESSKDPQSALDDAIAKSKAAGITPKILVLPDGCVTVPFIEKK